MIKTQNYTYNEENGQLVANTGYNVFVALNELFDFKINLLESYAAKNYKIVSDGLVFTGDFEDFLNMLNASNKVEVNVAKSNCNQVPRHVLFIKKKPATVVESATKEEPKKKPAKKVTKDAE